MFESILAWMHNLFGNYGLAVIAFTLLVRVVLFPFDFKSRKSMRKTARLQPKMAVLQKKYANDREKLNRKMQELYKQEGVSPLSGCLPMLLSYPILIIMFNAMRGYANQQMVLQVLNNLTQPTLTLENVKLESFLWIRNLYMADSPVVSRLVGASDLRLITADVWQKAITNLGDADLLANIVSNYSTGRIAEMIGNGTISGLQAFGITNTEALAGAVQSVNAQWLTASSFDQLHLSGTVGQLNMLLQTTEAYQANTPTNISMILLGTVQSLYNGFWILPILSAVSQLVMTKLNPTQTQPAAANDPNAQSQEATGKFMKWFFPIFSLWICASSTAAFALYWVVSNLLAMISTVAVNKYLDSKEKKDAIAGEGIVQ